MKKPYRFSELVLDARTGLNPRKNFVLGKGNNYYITIKDIYDGKIIISDKTELIDDDAMKIISKRSRLKKGDILFTSIGRIGETAIIKENPVNWNINESVFCFTLDLSKITREYFCWLFKSAKWRNFLERASTGSTFHSIKMGRLNGMNFIIPSITVQREQTRLLDSIKDQIGFTKNQLVLLNEQIKSLFIKRRSLA